MIPIFSNTLGQEELAAVERVFTSRWLGPGAEVEAFERELGEYWEVKGVQLVNSCTSALYIILKVLGVGPGDEVIVPGVHFVATLSAIRELGAYPVFCDVDPRTLNATPETVRRCVSNRTRAVVLLHYGGHVCDVRGIRAVVNGAYIVEDAACAVASRRCGISAGTLADAGCWSFDAMKVLVTGDGGAMWFKNPEHRARADRLRSLGIDKKSGLSNTGSDEWWRFRLVEPSGWFYANDIVAAIGREQLKKVDGFVARRQEIWNRYQRAFKGLCHGFFAPPDPPAMSSSTYYLYWVNHQERTALARYLLERNIYTTYRYYALPDVEGDERLKRLNLPGVWQANARTLNLPLHQNLTNEEVEYIIQVVTEWVVA
jgi:dTDP-4-amino-4,6-dideoxygalactose transaminase